MKVHDSEEMNSINKTTPIDITFKNLEYSIKTSPSSQRTILKGLNGICPSGQITAILGSSGAGKTTLLNLLCKRIATDQNGLVKGDILANGVAYNHAQFTNFANYVMQDDILMEFLTVRECIMFAANLKSKGSEAEKKAIVDDTIRQLKLEQCQNTLIGGHSHKGISGGERKRVSIGFELVCSPLALFLDEPTSGLDSFTAYILISRLKAFAVDKNRTVVLTIHQPSSDIWSMLDRIMLLMDGRFVYQGTGGQNILDYFNKAGFRCPSLSNPPDYFLQIMDQQQEVNAMNSTHYFENYNSILSPQVDATIKQSEMSAELPVSVSFNLMTQLKYLFVRAITLQFRNPILFKAKIGQTFSLAVFLGLIYWQIPDGSENPYDIVSVNNKNGLLFFLAMGMFMEALNPCVLSVPLERQVFLREYNSKLYGITPYFFSKLTVDLVTDFIIPILLSIIIYTMAGLRSDMSSFIFFVLVGILMQFVGIAVGYLQGCFFTDPYTAFSVAQILVIPLQLLSGFFKNRNDMSSWMKWMTYISPFKYGFEAFLSNEYEGTHFIPNPIESTSVEFGKWENFGYLSIHFFIYVALALYVLHRTTKMLQ